jgi:hypothetical protein
VENGNASPATALRSKCREHKHHWFASGHRSQDDLPPGFGRLSFRSDRKWLRDNFCYQAFTLFENWTVKVNACNGDVSLVKRLLLLRIIRTCIKCPSESSQGFA